MKENDKICLNVQKHTCHFEQSLMDLCRVTEGLASGVLFSKMIISPAEIACICQTDVGGFSLLPFILAINLRAVLKAA